MIPRVQVIRPVKDDWKVTWACKVCTPPIACRVEFWSINPSQVGIHVWACVDIYSGWVGQPHKNGLTLNWKQLLAYCLLCSNVIEQYLRLVKISQKENNQRKGNSFVLSQFPWRSGMPKWLSIAFLVSGMLLILKKQDKYCIKNYNTITASLSLVPQPFLSLQSTSQPKLYTRLDFNRVVEKRANTCREACKIQVVPLLLCNCQPCTVSVADRLGIPEVLLLTVQLVVLSCHIGALSVATWWCAALGRSTY